MEYYSWDELKEENGHYCLILRDVMTEIYFESKNGEVFYVTPYGETLGAIDNYWNDGLFVKLGD